MIPEYIRDRCVPPSREHSSWWRGLASPLQCCMPGRETVWCQNGSKENIASHSEKVFQLCKGQNVSLPFESSEASMWHMKIIKLDEVREIKWRDGISAPRSLTAWECRGMWLPWLTLVEGFLVHFLACATCCRLSQAQLECQQGPGNLSSSSLLTPRWQRGQIRGIPWYSAPACAVSALCCNVLN